MGIDSPFITELDHLHSSNTSSCFDVTEHTRPPSKEPATVGLGIK